MEQSQIRRLCAVIVLFLAGTGFVVPAWGGPRATPKTRSILLGAAPGGGLTVSVVNLTTSAPLMGAATAASLNLGAVSYGGSHSPGVTIEQRKSGFIVGTAFGLQVNDSSHQARFATVMAYISGPPTPLTYRIDGRTLGSVPVVVAPRMIVGAISRHNLEVEVPGSVSERNANQQAALQFEVLQN